MRRSDTAWPGEMYPIQGWGASFVAHADAFTESLAPRRERYLGCGVRFMDDRNREHKGRSESAQQQGDRAGGRRPSSSPWARQPTPDCTANCQHYPYQAGRTTHVSRATRSCRLAGLDARECVRLSIRGRLLAVRLEHQPFGTSQQCSGSYAARVCSCKGHWQTHQCLTGQRPARHRKASSMNTSQAGQ